MKMDFYGIFSFKHKYSSKERNGKWNAIFRYGLSTAWDDDKKTVETKTTERIMLLSPK